MNTIADFIRKERKKAGLIRQILGYQVFFDLTENSCITGRMKEEMKGLMETRAGALSGS